MFLSLGFAIRIWLIYTVLSKTKNSGRTFVFPEVSDSFMFSMPHLL